MRKRRNNAIKYSDDLFAVDDLDNSDGLDDSGELTLDGALELFLRDCKTRNLSEHTVKYYQNEIRGMAKMLTEQEQPIIPRKITPKIIEENLIYYMIEELQLKATTVNTRLRAVRAFFKFLYTKRHIPLNPARDIKLLKAKRNDIHTFSREQIGRLLKQPDLRTFTGLRDYTIMLLMLETGIRVKELSCLEIRDILWEDGKIVIREPKGHRVRMVPIQQDMKKQLRSYLKARGYDLSTDALFVNIDNEALSKRRIQEFVSMYGRRANLKGVRCSPHTFRHTFAKMCVQGGANVFELQAILGHSSLEMVRVYVNLFSDEIRERHKEFSPLRQLKNKK